MTGDLPSAATNDDADDVAVARSRKATDCNFLGCDLPFVLPHDVGHLGGTLKAAPAHFVVDEQLTAREDACDHGKHAYVRLQREGESTRDVAVRLADIFGVRPEEVGFAGLKDRHAVVTQTFSLPRDMLQPRELRTSPEGIAALCRAAGYAVEGLPRWHRGKLRRGELRANRFEVIVSATAASPEVAVAHAQRIANAMREAGGFANYFGPQRFGRGGVEHALLRGRKVLGQRFAHRSKVRGAAAQRTHSRWLDDLLLSGFQSALFNAWLAQRVRSGRFGSIHEGDVLTALPAGGRCWRLDGDTRSHVGNQHVAALEVSEAVPRVSDEAPHAAHGGAPADARHRHGVDTAAAFAAGAVSYTGPMLGRGCLRAGSGEAAMEEAVWSAYGVEGVQLTDLTALKSSPLVMGHRRVARLPLPSDLSIAACPEGVRFQFTLPPSSYATSLLREFIGDACGLADADSDDERAEADLAAAAEDPLDLPADPSSERAACASWARTPVRGWRLTCESPLHERKAIKEAIQLVEGVLAQTANEAAAARADTAARPAARADTAARPEAEHSCPPPPPQQQPPSVPPVRNSARCSIGSLGNGDAGAKGLTLLRCDDEGVDERVDVVAAVQRICADAQAIGAARLAPHVVRLLPVQGTCPVEHDAIVRALKPLLRARTSLREGWTSYAVQLTRRGKGNQAGPNARLDRAALIGAIGDEIVALAPHASVCLNQPETAVLVDVFDGGACVAVINGWDAMHECNLRKAGVQACVCVHAEDLREEEGPGDALAAP